MKNLALLMTLLVLTSGAALAKSQPLLLEPLSPSVLSNNYGTYQYNQPQVTVAKKDKTYQATYTPVAHAENMVPQNAAAEGKPVPAKKAPKVKVQTKQRSQGNSYWNPGGKGTKAYF